MFDRSPPSPRYVVANTFVVVTEFETYKFVNFPNGGSGGYLGPPFVMPSSHILILT